MTAEQLPENDLLELYAEAPFSAEDFEVLGRALGGTEVRLPATVRTAPARCGRT